MRSTMCKRMGDWIPKFVAWILPLAVSSWSATDSSTTSCCHKWKATWTQPILKRKAPDKHSDSTLQVLGSCVSCASLTMEVIVVSSVPWLSATLPKVDLIRFSMSSETLNHRILPLFRNILNIYILYIYTIYNYIYELGGAQLARPSETIWCAA